MPPGFSFHFDDRRTFFPLYFDEVTITHIRNIFFLFFIDRVKFVEGHELPLAREPVSEGVRGDLSPDSDR